MRIPKAAPKFEKLAQQHFSKGVTAWFLRPTEAARLAVDRAIEEAWNWEDCSYRASRAQLTPEQLWLLVKTARSQRSQVLPLRDTHGRNFRFVIPNSALKILSDADQGLAGVVATDMADVSKEEYRIKYIITSLQEEAFSSSAIEGAVATRTQAREMLRHNVTPKTKSEWMILNNFKTIKFLNARRQVLLTPELLLEVQKQLTENTLESPMDGGRFRLDSDQVTICAEETGETLHTPPNANELPARIQAMCDFANAPKNSDPYVHPVIRAVMLHFWLAYDHPFVDGNGRTARALFYWSMLKDGYYLAEFLSISSIIAQQPKQYYQAYLNTENDDNDATYFLTYHLKVLDRSIQAFHEYLRRKKREQDEVLSLLGQGYNPRQRDLLHHAIKNPIAIFTYGSHANSQGVTLATARADILDLVERGALIQNTKGRKFEFTPHPDILKQLQKKKRKA